MTTYSPFFYDCTDGRRDVIAVRTAEGTKRYVHVSDVLKRCTLARTADDARATDPGKPPGMSAEDYTRRLAAGEVRRA